MKKKMILAVLCGMTLCLAACGNKDEKESDHKDAAESVIEFDQTSEAETTETKDAEATTDAVDTSDAQTSDKAEMITKEQALEAIKNYCYTNDPGLKDMEGTDEYTIFWDVSANDAGEIVVLYRSYTAAQIRYYIDPTSGETYVTELVPGIIDEEQRTEETLNVRDYMSAKPEGSSEEESTSGRKDGERFESEIMMEGMIETVEYEHAVSKSMGFELDYEYDSLLRNSGSDEESFMSKYDDPKDPYNYLLVKLSEIDAESTLAELKESLAGDFDEVTTEETELEGTGKCQCLIALGVKNKELPDGALKRVYIIPTGKGCIIAEANYTIESAEGFGTRFVNMINTLTLSK